MKKPKLELDTLIRIAAAKKGMSAAIVEKDFWVCVTLDYLFQHSKWAKHIAFKEEINGGH